MTARTLAKEPVVVVSRAERGRNWLTLLRYEFTMAMRSRLGLVLLAACCLGGIIVGMGHGLGPSLVAYRAWRMATVVLTFALLPLMGIAARLDETSMAADGVESRAEPAAGRLLRRFLANLIFSWFLALVLIGVAWLVQLAIGGPVPEGAGSRFSLLAPLDAFWYAVVPIAYVAALAYCVTTLAPNTLSVAIVGLYWVMVLLGRDFVSRVFDVSLSQNRLTYVLLTVALVLLAMQIAHWRGRAGRPWRPWLSVPALVLLAFGLHLAATNVVTRHDPPFHSKPIAIVMQGQAIRNGVLPGFWLPDQHGQRVGLHDLQGGPYVIGFWSPMMPESLIILPYLQRLHEQYGERGLRVIGICLSDDWSVAGRFARERGYYFPMLTDTGCHWADQVQDSSPLAVAYELLTLPELYMGDRDRAVYNWSPGVLTEKWWPDLQAGAEALLASPVKGGEAGG